MKIGNVYTHTHTSYMRMSSNNFYTNSSITLMYSLPYIQALEGKSLPAGKTCLPECHN